MKSSALQLSLDTAVAAAREAGGLMQKNLRRTKQVNEATRHDLKLDLDVQCQERITRRLAVDFPEIPVLGEEGADPEEARRDHRWVVDPIDGTVNYAHGIPHASVSIALQQRTGAGFETVAGVVYDPFLGELWTALRGKPARLNGRRIRVSTRRRLDESVISLGFAKTRTSLDRMLPVFNHLVHRVRKIRLMGSAALALAYVADGRFDGYVESGIRLWDIAAGGLLVESAGGIFRTEPVGPDYRYSLNANNGGIDRALQRVIARRGPPAPTS